MKILLISPGYTPVLPSSKRSVETSIYLLTKELAKLGHDVTVVDIKTSKPRGQTNVIFHELWSPNLEGSNIISYFLKVIVFTLQIPIVLYKNKDTDIIQTYSQFPTAITIILKKLFKLGAQVFYLTCSPYLTMPPSLSNNLKHTLIEKWVLGHTDKLLVHTNSGIRLLVQQFKLNPSKVFQVYAGIDLEEIDKYCKDNQKNPKNPHLIFYPAVVTPRKNQMAIVKAIPQVLEIWPNCKFVFAGPIEDQTYYNEMQGLPNVEFMGQITKTQIFKLYQEANIMVFPTLFEMQGIVLIEAMAFGLPIIASNIEVIQDVVNLDKGCVMLVNPSSQDFGKAIIVLLNDRSLRETLSHRGRKLAFSRFAWSRIAQDIEEKYEQVTK